MNPKIFFLLFISLSSVAYSQIDVRKIASKLDISSVYVNKLDKMSLNGISKDKLENTNTNLYYYHSAQGFGQSKAYLDKNNIDLFLNKEGLVYIIFDAGFKKKLTSVRNCYNSIEIDNKSRKAKITDLFEEDKLNFISPNLLSVYSQNGLDNNSLYASSEILLGFNPPLYFFKTYYEIPRQNISSSKYGFNIELVLPNTILDLYKILSVDMKNKTFNDKFLEKINESLQTEISGVSALAPKGEFETTEKYYSRIEEGEEQKLQIEEKYNKLISEFKLLAEKDMLDKVNNSLEQVILKIDSIGNYDADNQTFPITINGITKNIKIPIEQARDFKTKKDVIKVIADEQLTENGENLKFFNIIIINPISGENIDF